MAHSFSKSLLAAVVALVVSGVALAQDPSLREGTDLLRQGRKEEALAKFREVLASDPSNEDALRLYRSISQDEWFLLMSERGDIQQIAQSILERAKVERKARSRDAETIQTLVDAAVARDGDYDSRRAAVLKLMADHGEFAVPALVRKLGDADDADGQIHAIAALSEIGSPAVLPLIEALKSSNELVRLNAAAALSHINDDRATPAMARLAQLDDRANVKAVASRFLARKKVSGAAADLYVAEARRYLQSGNSTGTFSEVVWTLKDDQLVAHDVPALVYSLELAKAAAHEAVAIAPGSAAARSLVAQTNLAAANVIHASIAQGDESVKALEGVADEFRMVALAAGPETLRAALEDGLRNGLAPVAVGAIQALAMAESPGSIGSPAMKQALQSTDKRIAYAAAEALAKVSGGIDVPERERVLAVLAQAVAEEAVKTIQVIDPTNETAAAVSVASGNRGVAIDASGTRIDGMRKLLVNPNVDVVVVNEILPDGLPEDLIRNVKADPRMANVRVLVIAKDVEAAQARFGDLVHGVVQAPLTGENLVAAVNTALEGVAPEARNVRAEGYAKNASEALLAMSAGKAGIASALPSLAAQLNRADAVAIPAAKALGHAGTQAQLDALIGAIGGGGSLELKVAAAEAAGAVLARMPGCPDAVLASLRGVLSSDADPKLRTAVALALGKAKLSAAQHGEVIESLRKIGSAPSSEG